MKIGCLTICTIFTFVLCVLKLIGLISITWIQAFIPLLMWLGVAICALFFFGLFIAIFLFVLGITSKNKDEVLQKLEKQLEELENELKNRKW